MWSICRSVNWGGAICQGGRLLFFQIKCFLQIETPWTKDSSQSYREDRGAGRATHYTADNEFYRLRIGQLKHIEFNMSVTSVIWFSSCRSPITKPQWCCVLFERWSDRKNIACIITRRKMMGHMRYGGQHLKLNKKSQPPSWLNHL